MLIRSKMVILEIIRRRVFFRAVYRSESNLNSICWILSAKCVPIAGGKYFNIALVLQDE